MGSGMVEAARRRGYAVTAWNRTVERARALEQFGARVAHTPEDAVRNADHVHIVLSDDAAVDGVLARLAPALQPKAVVIDHSTVSPEGTKKRFAWCDEHHVAFLHAPVFMSPQACRDATGIMLCAGPTARFESVRPALEKMTGDLWYVGERPDLAAATSSSATR
jgi:3-hydroxyisobutyrate dehydrogenase